MLPPYPPFRNKAKKPQKSAVARGLRQLEAAFDELDELDGHDQSSGARGRMIGPRAMTDLKPSRLIGKYR